VRGSFPYKIIFTPPNVPIKLLIWHTLIQFNSNFS
jgi:hypothetical protein